MKNLLVIFLILSFAYSFGQDSINGQLFDLKKNQKIKLEKSSEMPKVWLFGNGKVRVFDVSENGQFYIDASEINELGKSLRFSIFSFNKNDIENDYADFEISNIPRAELQRTLKEVYLLKAYWNVDAGSAFIDLNVEKTFKEKVMWISTPSITYLIRRIPEKIDNLQRNSINYSYKCDFQNDIIE